MGGDILGEPMLCISWLEDGAIEAIWPQPFIEVGGPHGLLHILGGEHPLGDLYSRLKTRPHCHVLLCVHLVVSTCIHLLEVLGDRFIHLVSVADQLVIYDDGSNHRVAALHPQDFLSCCVEGLQVAGSEEIAELIQHLMVM